MREPEKQSGRNKYATKRHLLIGALVLLVLVLVVGCVVWRHHAKQNAWGKITFQEYAPGYLPGDLSVISKTIDADYTPAGDPTRTTTLNLKLSGHSYIYEKKSAHPTRGCQENVTNERCSQEVSSQGQGYTLTTKTVPGQPIEQVVAWQESNTDIRVTFWQNPLQPYSLEILGKVVDSFSPVTYPNLPVNYYDHSKI